MNLFKKYYILAENQEIINEDIYGNKAIIYHRTKSQDFIKGFYTKGYKPKTGFYGNAFYGTYDLESQLREAMIGQYGKILVKFYILSLDRFFFFDYEEFIKSPVGKKLNSSKKTFIQDQLNYFYINDINIEDFLISLKKELPQYSSEIARKFYEKTNISRLVDGIVFTGYRDGKVLACYNLDLISPLSYSDDEGKTWQKIEKDPQHLKKLLSQKTDERREIRKVEKDHWIYKAKISKDAKYDIDPNNGNVTWYSGTWYDGVWKDGLWKKGTWKGGTWENGEWNKGTWEGGTWENGEWADGTWKDGIWKSGIWVNGTWKKGIWEIGHIYDRFHQGNFKEEWPTFYKKQFRTSPISPKEYFKGKTIRVPVWIQGLLP
jgi:hypothetical protein